MNTSIDMEKLREDAVHIFNSGFTCSESVLYAIKKNFELENYGAACCRVLTRGMEKQSPERKAHCTKMVSGTVVKTAEIILANLKDSRFQDVC